MRAAGLRSSRELDTRLNAGNIITHAKRHERTAVSLMKGLQLCTGTHFIVYEYLLYEGAVSMIDEMQAR